MPVNVRDIQEIREFRLKLLRFADELAGALQAMQMQVQRGFEWIEQDRPRYWTVQTRKAFDLVAATRTALHMCQMKKVAGHRPACIEEKVAYDKAKRRLAHCQEQIDNVRSCAQALHHQANEFRGRLSGLQRLLDQDLPRAVAYLEKTAETLEAYAEVARPAPPPAAPSGESPP